MSDHIFIHSELDDAGLSPAEFRVLAHLCRRAGKDGVCHPGIRSISQTCHLSRGTVVTVLESLENRKFVTTSKRHGLLTEYVITTESGIAATVSIQGTPSVSIQGTPSETDGRESVSPTVSIQGTPTVSIQGTPSVSIQGTDCINPRHGLYQSKAHKVIHEGNPLKEDVVKTSVAQELADAWNQSGKLQKVLKLTPKRTAAITSRLSDQFFSDNWRAALAKIEKSAFCTGFGPRSWKADLDWFIRPDSCLRIMEGKYDDRNNSQNQNANTTPQKYGNW